MKKAGKVKRKNRISCHKCKSPADCCRFGAWIDLEEAKKIVSAGIEGVFFHLEKDDEFPSGYRVGTSYEDNPCSFLGSDGLCAIHKIDYGLKPITCKDFPYENNEVSPLADVLCVKFKSRLKKGNKKK